MFSHIVVTLKEFAMCCCKEKLGFRISVKYTTEEYFLFRIKFSCPLDLFSRLEAKETRVFLFRR